MATNAAIAAENWIRNGSFETTAGKAVAEWTVHTGGAVAESDAAVAKNGGKSLRIESKTPRPLEEIVRQTGAIPTNTPAGATLRLSFWYKTDRVVFGQSGWIGVRVRFADAAHTNDFGQPLSVNDYRHMLYLEPSAEWKYVEKYLPTHNALNSFEIRAGLGQCGGTVWFDGFSLCVLDARRQLTLFSRKAPSPALDGKLDDACWSEAQVALGFMPLGKIEPADPDTEVMSCFDDERVYFGIKCRPDKADAHLTDSDSLEIYMDPFGTGAGWYYFNVDRQGKCEVRVVSSNGTDSLTAVAATTAVVTNDGGWALELSVPFAELGVAKPADNRRWGFDVVRHIKGGRDSSWAAVGFPYCQLDWFGALQFYSGSDIAAKGSGREPAERDPLMLRRVVSGVEIAKEPPAPTSGVVEPDLWTYDPYQAHLISDLSEPYRDGLTPALRAELPEFYNAALGIDRLLVHRAFLDEKIGNAKRAEFYSRTLAASNSAAGPEALSPSPAAVERETAEVDRDLNDAYHVYGRAFGRNRAQAATNAAKLAGMPQRLADLDRRMTGLDTNLDLFLADTVTRMKSVRAWKSASLALPPEAKRLNRDGVSQRFYFSYYDEYQRMTGPKEYRLEAAYNSLLGPFDSRDIGHTFIDTPELDGQGRFNFSKYRTLIEEYKTNGVIEKFFVAVPFGYGRLCSGMAAPWLLEEAKTNKDILLMSQDGYAHDSGWGPPLNINNPDALNYTRGYLREMARQISSLAETHFFLTGQESGSELTVLIDGRMSDRSLGYSPSGIAAFRRYLEERYGTVAALNRKWRSSYASFAAVTPPDDKHIKPPEKASGLAYEFERWQRVNLARYLAKVREFLKEGAPNVPVMADPHYYLSDMNGYIAYKEHNADIQSFHLNPSRDEAMWVYMNTMNRVFGRVTGYLENYWGMFRRAHLNDERLAKRDVQKFFFSMFMWDVRYSAWWPWHDTADLGLNYCIYYNSGPCRSHYNQTILKWSTTALPEMFARCRRIEKALIESRPEVPRTAIVQPCASAFTLASLGRTEADSPIFNHMFDLHNRLLQPKNLPHDYLPEEMVLDGKAKLSDYTLLFIPYGPYLSEAFSAQLAKWVKKGGVLVAIGPFSLWNEFGYDIAPSGSLFKTLFPQWRRTGKGDWDYTIDGSDKAATPAVTNASYGRGKLVYLNCPLDVVLRNAALRAQLDAVLADSAEWTAKTENPDLELLMRDGESGERYLGICNENVEWPTESEVIVKGKYSNPLDILIPGWFPVPSRIENGQTIMKIRLEPGEWTIIRLK